MNTGQIDHFLMRYLEATDSLIMEKSPHHITVKLSPEADKDLTGRTYYWSFVERTGAPAETITIIFILNPEAYLASQQGSSPGQAGAGTSGAHGTQPGAGGAPGTASFGTAAIQPTGPGNSILSRYFGVSPAGPVGRMPKDEVTFGSRRLDQIFAVVRGKGRFVRLFEQTKLRQRGQPTHGYETWLGVNFRIELCCDMKRDELHCLGIHLGTGEIRERFYEQMLGIELTPRLQNNVFLQPPRLTVARAGEMLENYLLDKISRYDRQWAIDADLRLKDELAMVDVYYGDLLATLEDEPKRAAEEQYVNRRSEIEWQYSPKIRICAVNCGLFHLDTGNRSHPSVPG